MRLDAPVAPWACRRCFVSYRDDANVEFDEMERRAVDIAKSYKVLGLEEVRKTVLHLFLVWIAVANFYWRHPSQGASFEEVKSAYKQVRLHASYLYYRQ